MIKILLILIPIIFFLIPYAQLANAQVEKCLSGATVELDQKTYSWTDKVYITIVAPCYNFDSNLIDEIGSTEFNPIKIASRNFDISSYKLIETGTDTGNFTGEIILTGFLHDADGNSNTGNVKGYDTNPQTSGTGPADGFLETGNEDDITVSFEVTTNDPAVVGSALIRWNIGKVQWLEASYPASGTGVVRVTDPDMNLKPEAVDNFNVNVWSDSDAGGIDLTVTETNEATGIFEGTVFFTTTDESSGHRLRVAEGDTVTAEYSDNTLPNPYTTADELDITDQTIIGGSNVWLLDQIKGSTLKLENNDGAIVFPENIDIYFPYNRDIKEKIQNLAQSGKLDSKIFSEKGYARYIDNQLIVTKISEITISNYDEFVLIFGKDRDSINTPVQFKDEFGDIIDENTINQKIQSALDACGTNKKNYCSMNFEELKKQILEKTGKHVIKENLIIKQITGTSEKIKIENLPAFNSMSPQNHISEFTNFKPLHFEEETKNSIIPIAEAQSGQFKKITNGVYDLSFLDGFTIGFGYERDWSYQFNVAQMIPISVETHIENGVGMGLRIPINLFLAISSIKENESTRDVILNVKHRINTEDIDEEEYSRLGLSSLQTFEGKEFNMYFGPRANVLIKMFDRTVFEKSWSPVPFELPEKNDFVPPLGANNIEETITEYTIPCEISKVCYTSKLATVGLFVGGKAKLVGGEITTDSELLNPQIQKQKLEFTQQNQEKSFSSQKISVSDPNKISYKIKIDNVIYHSNLHIVPNISIEASFEPWIFPINVSRELIELPRIEFNGIQLDPHDGVESMFIESSTVPEFGGIVNLILIFGTISVIAISFKIKGTRLSLNLG